MTPQEALYWHTHNGATVQQEIEIESIIIDALNKQIHKKPVKRYTEDLSCTNKFNSCPFCGSFEIEDCEHCPDCGQALDWSDTYD